jgi:hypothetical protein
MDGNPTCKLCGHEGDDHTVQDGGSTVVCGKCPDRLCQDGADGEAYRASL